MARPLSDRREGAFTLRPGVPADAAAVAGVFSPSLRLLTFLPPLRTVAEDRRFIAGVIFRECAVTVAEDAGEIVAFLARDGQEIRLLHTHPDHIGRGAGSRLIAAAQQAAIADALPVLELWCFQANTRARRFYERHGFTAVEFTDGSNNEERTPDVRYRWTPS